ncbi:RING finger protein 151-like isoform X2 [Amblyomma americanum]
MPAASAQYTLVGFSPELDWRALKFVKPLPPHRVCGACGLVRNRTALLPCTHVLCECCYEQCGRDGSHACPLDGNHYEEEDVALMDFPAEELLRREVRCWNEDSGAKL